MNIVEGLTRQGIVPLFCDTDVDRACRILECCSRAGINYVEFTIRAEQALEAFVGMSSYAVANIPGMVLGVGSVISGALAQACVDAGAGFIVSPAFDADVCKVAKEAGVPYVPGCYSPTEMHQAMKAGAAMCKLFPADAIDGPGFVKAVRAPMPKLQIMATGGVSPERENLARWFGSGVSCVGMGSKLINPSALKSDDDFVKLEQQMKDLLAMTAELRVKREK